MDPLHRKPPGQIADASRWAAVWNDRKITCKNCGSEIDTRSWTMCCGSPA